MKEKENLEVVLFQAPYELKQRVRLYCAKNSISIKSLLCRIIKEYMDKLKITSS